MDTINDIATIIALVRDSVLLLLLTVALFAFIVIAKKVVGLLNTAKQTTEKAQEILETVSEKVVTPAASNPRAFRAFGSVLGFLMGFLRRSRD